MSSFGGLDVNVDVDDDNDDDGTGGIILISKKVVGAKMGLTSHVPLGGRVHSIFAFVSLISTTVDSSSTNYLLPIRN